MFFVFFFSLIFFGHSEEDESIKKEDITVTQAFRKFVGSIYYVILQVYHALKVAFSPIFTPIYHVVCSAFHSIYRFFYILTHAVIEALNLWHIALIQSLKKISTSFQKFRIFRKRNTILANAQPASMLNMQRRSYISGEDVEPAVKVGRDFEENKDVILPLNDEYNNNNNNVLNFERDDIKKVDTHPDINNAPEATTTTTTTTTTPTPTPEVAATPKAPEVAATPEATATPDSDSDQEIVIEIEDEIFESNPIHQKDDIINNDNQKPAE